MRKKVLIVDDEIGIRDAISFCLLANGYNVILAGDGAAALSEIERCDGLGNDLEMIILDLDMPVMSGIEFLEHAKRRGISKPILLMSGSGRVLEETAEDPLVAQILPKPFSESALLEKVGQIAGRF